jgi:hypothetical protein
MKRRLDTLVDKGCWISHDRIYAFVSADHGITEIGYHGMQPVSKNSRIMVKESGVLSFSLRNESGEEKLQTSGIDWEPTGVSAETELTDGSCSMAVQTSGRQLVIQFRLSSSVAQTMCIRLARDSFFTAVHGERTWSRCRQNGNAAVASFRDRIMLQSWLSRTGPYAGDFLIPEPTRKKIFTTSKRSGLATRDDLREEFRTSDMTLYDATISLRFSGAGFSVQEMPEAFLFERRLGPGGMAEFIVEFSDVEEQSLPHASHLSPADASANASHRSTPTLRLKDYPQLEEFTKTVPALVDSCIVHDHGVPRACPGRYYWIWAWDSLVTMVEALRWGESHNAGRTVRFIEDHRDDNGRIPARWTRSLLPLDTPSPGGIEFLQISLAYETFLETGDRSFLMRCFPSFIDRFEEVENQLVKRGYVVGEGFYPDLLAAFGRSEHSAVCMEVGSWYTYCRILANIAHELGDPQLEKRLAAAAASIAVKFDDHFWDREKGFFVDSLHADTESSEALHPLFTLLFLQSPFGLQLIRSHLDDLGKFVSRDLMTDAGVRALPLSEAGVGGEAVLDSWYPHWDLYALKVLRRTEDAESIMRWLACAERALTRLGYCSEFLALKGFRENDTHAWEQHGSASNLNCVTSWMRGLRESVVGFEFDAGGITHIPLSLPIPAAHLDGVRWRDAEWSFETLYEGPYFESLVVDGTIIEGCAKIPVTFQTRGNHHVTARYGSKPPLPLFTEVVNAKVMTAKRTGDAVEIIIEPLGSVDVAFFSSELPVLIVNQVRISAEWNPSTGRGYFSLPDASPCTLRIQKA